MGRVKAARCTTCGTPLREGSCLRCPGGLEREDWLEGRGRGAPGRLLLGLRLALRGARLTLLRPRLLGLVVLPLLLDAALFVGLVYLVWTRREAWTPDWTGPWPYGLEALRSFLVGAVEAAVVLVGVLLALLGTLLLSTVVAAPFLEWLSEAVETLVLGGPDRRPLDLAYVVGVWLRPLLQALLLALLQGAAALLLLTLSLLGVLAPLGFLGGVLLTAASLVDVVVARKGYRVLDRFRLVARDLPLWFGVALPFFLAPFLLPLGAAGATLAYLRSLQDGRADPKDG